MFGRKRWLAPTRLVLRRRLLRECLALPGCFLCGFFSMLLLCTSCTSLGRRIIPGSSNPRFVRVLSMAPTNDSRLRKLLSKNIEEFRIVRIIGGLLFLYFAGAFCGGYVSRGRCTWLDSALSRHAGLDSRGLAGGRVSGMRYADIDTSI